MKVGMVKPCHLVKPVSVTLASGRNLSQQMELPRQPVPDLQQTCNRYLSFLEPMVEVDELKRTQKLTEEFLKAGGDGERLQRGLERKAHNSENWFTEDYLKMDYLYKRHSVVGYSNPGALYPETDYRDKKGQIRFAAKFIAATMDLKTMIDNETLPVEYMRGKPLCMKQYEQLFSSCRKPGLNIDTIEYYTSNHITVVHNGQFFVLEMYNSDGTLLTVDQLCVQLERIYNSSLQTNMEPVGILTTQHRDVWAKHYTDLIKDKTNKESVSALERSIVTVCLDGAMPPASDNMYRTSGFHQVLHGGGSQWNGGNRWFDKGIQLIIGEDGIHGVTFSNTAADGVVMTSVNDFIIAAMKKPQVTRATTESLPEPQKLQFNLTPELKKNIEEAKQHLNILVQDLQVCAMVFKHYGKTLIKAHKMSPDGFLQIALQLAYYRMHQKITSSLEPVSLRTFRLGRLSVMNTNTPAAVAFVMAFDDPKIQNPEKVDLLDKAMKAHVQNIDMALKGQDIYCHLWALQHQAVQEKIPMHDFFKDTSFKRIFDFKLAGSNITSKAGVIPCFGPEEPGQYDVVYSMKNNYIEFALGALKSDNVCNESNAARLARATENALLDMRTLLEQTTRG
ncbi:hypothetical protein ABVT39_008415 [Epinephelus coioides]